MPIHRPFHSNHMDPFIYRLPLENLWICCTKRVCHSLMLLITVKECATRCLPHLPHLLPPYTYTAMILLINQLPPIFATPLPRDIHADAMTCMVMCAFDALYAVPDRSLWNHQALYHAWRVEVLQMVSILRYIMSLYCKLILIFSCISHTAFVYWMISHTALFVNVARNSDKMRKTKRATRAGETIFCLCTCREKTQTVRVRSKHRTIRVTMCACLHLTVM
jgi:hypothetical protein